MGGFGSGRRGGKDCTDDMHRVDVRRLQRDECLTPGMGCDLQWTRRGVAVASIHLSVQAQRVTFTYRHRAGNGHWQEVHCAVPLDRTPCHYGGTRAWWLCPCCGRRVALLYIGKLPACRHCYRLAYRSEREASHYRAARRADTIRHRLGWKPGFLSGSGPKPKGMHWRTFERLRAEHDAHADAAWAGAEAELGLMGSRSDNIQWG